MSRTRLAVATGAAHSRILGLGSYRPERIVPNSEIVDAIDSTDEWIQQRTGIKERRWASEHETVKFMAVEAAQGALEAAGLDGSQIDVVLVATVSHLMQTPAMAPMVAHAVGSTGAAYDVSAACAGFCLALASASDMVKAGSAKHVLVIGVERLTDILDTTDRGSAFIFADGAGAAVVGPSDEPGIAPVVWGSDGEKFDFITQTEGWLDAMGTKDRPGSGIAPVLTMQGNAVFRWASFSMAKIAQQALDAAGVAIEDLDVFVPHQANMRIIDAMSRAMKLPDTVKVARDIATQGNTSAASVPMALHRMVAEGEARSGDLALLIAFGAGLAYAAQVVVVP